MSDRQRGKMVTFFFLALALVWVFFPTSGDTSFTAEESDSASPHGRRENTGKPPQIVFHISKKPGSLASLDVSLAMTLGGTCVSCHVNITPAHTKQAFKCIDCHGGNDQVVVTGNNIRDKAIMAQAHVQPKDPTFFWPNGIANTFAGAPGKGITEFDAFNNNLDPVDNTGRAGTHIDAEYSRDLNYVRFINPSDYRVAMVGCGSRSPAETFVGQCHGQEVINIRKSIMANNQGQFATALFANHAPVGATNDNPLGTRPTGTLDPRDGQVGTVFNYDDIDAAYNPDTNSFDSARLLAIAKTDSDPFNDNFEAIGEELVDKDGRTRTVRHGGDTPADRPQTIRLRGIGGKRLIAQAQPRALRSLLPWVRRDSQFDPQDPTSSLIKTVLNVYGFTGVEGHQPVDAGFNAVRAFDPALFPDVNQNFPFPFDDNQPDRIGIVQSRGSPEQPDVMAQNGLEFVPPNPFNRNRNSGCASCHMLYRADGKNQEPFDKTVKENGRNPSTSIFNGMNENRGERGYPAIHQLTTKIPTDQCGICHVFTTRVDVAFKGTFEIENNNFNFRFSSTADAAGKNVPLTFTTRRGSKLNIFDNLARVNLAGNAVIHDGEDRSEDRNNNGELDDGEDRNGNGFLDIPDRLQRSDAQDGRQMRIMYGGASGAVRLMDIHLERGMECIDCHFFQDLHGDGNIFTRNWDFIEIECVDCHGTAGKLANLRTSGPTGGNDLRQSFDENGVPFFEIASDGSRIQRSRVRDGLTWRIPQVKEAITPGNEHFNPQAQEAMGVRSSTNSKEFAHMTNKSRQTGKLECYSCHAAAQPQCFACHYSQDYFPLPNPANPNPFTHEPRRPDQQQMEIWMGEKFVPFPNFFFFGIVRSPYILGINGDTEFNKISTFRSIMELNVSVGAPNGDTVVSNTSFTATTHDLAFPGERPRSGSTLNPYMPHTVRLNETKDCDVCHTLRDNNGAIRNNHLLAGSFGLGTGRYHDIGDWVYAPLQGPTPSLLLMDIKKEENLIINEADAPQKVNDTQPKTQQQINQAKRLVNNVFPGFNVDNTNDPNNPNLNLRGKFRKVEFSGAEDASPFVNPRDTALIRNYTAKDHRIRGADLVFVADGAGGVKVVLATALDGSQIARTERRQELEASGQNPDQVADAIRRNLGPVVIANTPTVNAQGVDVVSSDLSDEFVYVADGEAGAKILFTHEIFRNVNGADVITPPQIAGSVDTPGFANKVKIEGDFLYVADGAAGLSIIDVSNRNAPQLVRTVNTNGNARDVAVYGVFAFIANGNNGMAVVDISDPANAQLVTVFNASGAINDARGIDYADNRAYIADGANGLRILDITVPATPALLFTVNQGENGTAIDDAESVMMATVPFRTFAMVCDGENGLRAINVTDFRDIRERLFFDRNGSSFSKTGIEQLDTLFQTNFNMTLALRDPLTPFDRANVRLSQDGNTVINPAFQIITFPVSAGQRLLRIARGRQLDKLGDESGRTLRDSTAVGARALPSDIIQRMRNVNVIEQQGTGDRDGNGLGNIVLQSVGTSNASKGSTAAIARPTASVNLDKKVGQGLDRRGLFVLSGIALLFLMAFMTIRRFKRPVIANQPLTSGKK